MRDIPIVFDTPAYGGPATPTSIAGIYVPRSMQFDLDERVVEVLERQGFVVVPGQDRLFHPIYQESEYEGEVYFVTTDVGYHYLHLAFSKILRELEEKELLPILEDLYTGLVGAARAQRDELAGTELEWAGDRVVQLYEAGAVLAGVDVGPIGELAEEEVELALAAADLAKSPITGLVDADALVSMYGLVDYSLFRPRGHYTRNTELERYFRGMSLLGNENFVIDKADPMLLAALASRVLVDDPALLEAWRLIYEPTAFMVGMADDYSPTELSGILDELAPDWRIDPDVLTPEIALAAGERLWALRRVAIDPEGASVRLMGARFVVDSYVYDQLRFPSVGDPPFGRVAATPLDLVAAFGSDLAYRIMDQRGDLTDPTTGEHYRHYDDQLGAMQDMLATRTLDDWAGTVYDAWLWAFEPVWQPLGEAYPDFMRSEAWEVKNLQTGLGSYAELKHDTVLYAKQSYAAEGDYQPVEYPPPRHWVEPNPAAFSRMVSVLDLLGDGLSSRGLLPVGSNNDELIDALRAFLDRLARIAGDELAGRPISAEDNDWLRGVGSTLEALWIQSAETPDELEGEWPDEDLNSALIADIMRSTEAVLEIGTGYVDSLYVLVPDDAGRFQIAKGAVYSYYEFWRSIDEGRLTDQEWWELLATSPPERPSWQDPLVPSPVYDVGLPRGLGCWSFADEGYPAIVAYWLAYGMPLNFDWETNGIPCDEDPTVFDSSFYAGLPTESGLYCRDLKPSGYTFAEAVGYWLQEGAPDRMDADRNGVPCETVYLRDEIDAFFAIGD